MFDPNENNTRSYGNVYVKKFFQSQSKIIFKIAI